MKLRVCAVDRMTGEDEYTGVFDTETMMWEHPLPTQRAYLHTAYYRIYIDEDKGVPEA